MMNNGYKYAFNYIIILKELISSRLKLRKKTWQKLLADTESEVALPADTEKDWFAGERAKFAEGHQTY